MKVAGHELKGHTSLVACGMMAGLSFGMMCLIDFRGYRLLCTSQLPISQDTLVYGSMDGGNTVLNESAAMSEKLQHCGEILNLKPHIAGLQSPQLMHGPCDIEGHIGKDGNYYVIDLARLWPPRTPRPDLPGSFLYRLSIRARPVMLECASNLWGEQKRAYVRKHPRREHYDARLCR